ncbi:hypothetical protein EXU48_07585 [Occultella glacieicola]|uniref:3-hydroxyacyl-CoA dehydrogenase n=1 Tax=Occultella glacieicola TaxID=2518684 RepID=A0ABY2E686_9MICO|nr:Rv3235 family protein [Occultella glacieicola]TDE96089.1 hypothetical protein EXU48_07585 [Occultella glacieicola]
MSVQPLARPHPAPEPACLPGRVPRLLVQPGSPGARTWDRVRFTGPPASAETAADQESSDTCPRLVWSRGEVPELPDAATWSGTLVRACVEALLGTRPAAQLARWLDADLWTALNRRVCLGMEIAGRPTRPPMVTIRRVHSCEVAEGSWESSVVIHDGTRVRAAAIRLETRRARWRATALEIG